MDDREKSKINWGWDGEDYRQNSLSQQTRALTALKALDLKPGTSVLDVGCGDGKITNIIALSVAPANVTGLDNDPSMIETARKFFSSTQNLNFILHDIRGYNGPTVDLITSFFCLQWIPEVDLGEVFKNLFNLLNPNGQLCLLLAAYDFPHEVIKGLAKTEKWAKHFEGFKDGQTFLDAAKYQTLLEQANFHSSRAEMVTSTHFLTPQEFVDFTRQWCGCYTYMKSTELQHAFSRDVLAELEKLPKNADGKFTMTQKSMKLTANRPTPAPVLSETTRERVTLK